MGKRKHVAVVSVLAGKVLITIVLDGGTGVGLVGLEPDGERFVSLVLVDTLEMVYIGAETNTEVRGCPLGEEKVY